MKQVIEFIEQKKQEFAQLPLLKLMRDKSVDPSVRLSWAPCVTPFAMNFGDLNRYVIRQIPADSAIQEMINVHTYEDDHHWLWFLKDLEKLGFNHSLPVCDTLKFLWGEDTKETRLVCNRLGLLFAAQTDPAMRLAIVEANEATGHVMLYHTAEVANDLTAQNGTQYGYFGPSHFGVETGHPMGTDKVEALIEDIELTPEQRTKACELVSEVFDAFTAVVHEFMAYVNKYSLESPYKLKAVTIDPEIAPHAEVDYLIIGAGPAGLQLGYFLEQSQRNYLILESGEAAGTFIAKFPRHRQLISINKRYTGYNDPEINLRWDWNSLLCDDESMRFTRYSDEYFPNADAMVQYLGDFAARYQLKIQYDTKVCQIAKPDGFVVVDQNGQHYRAKRLIMATGVSLPYLPEIEGVELAEKYTEMSLNREEFANQRVLIIGKGNSAFESADHLMASASLIHLVSPTPVNLAWKTKYVGHLRAVNNNLLDTYQLKSQNVVLDAHVKRIERVGNELLVTFYYTHADEEEETITYDRVLLCAGFKFDASIFDANCQPALAIHQRFPAQTSAWESTNISDLYFAGTITHMRDFKKKQSGFIHGFRYNVKALAQILADRYHGQPLPSQTIALTPQVLTNAVLGRMNNTSALWQQTGFLGDVIVVNSDGTGSYYQDLSVDYVHDTALGQQSHYYVITLEFGLDIIFASPDPLAVERIHKDDVARADLSSGIHPIIRRYCGSTLIAEHHVIEDIASEWAEEVHVDPLIAFFQTQLALPLQPLGYHLQAAGLVEWEQVQTALKHQMASAAPLGKIMAEQGWVSQQTVDFMTTYHSELLSQLRPKRVGEWLVQAGLISDAQIQTALTEQTSSRQLLGEILVQRGLIQQQTLDYFLTQVQAGVNVPLESERELELALT